MAGLRMAGRQVTAAALLVLAMGQAAAQPAPSPVETSLPPADCREDVLLIAGPGQAPLRVAVEVADDPASRAAGLMFRRSLDPGHGMLFIYDQPQPVAFWMRNTLIPLDMIFADPQGRIRHIHRMARPLDETPIPGAAVGDPDPDRLLVLEIAGGQADLQGLAVGQVMAHPALDPDLAAWPCS